MDKTRAELIGEIRYTIRLTQRTARLYRRVQSAGTFLAAVGGSGTIAALSDKVPAGVSMAGALMFVTAGAALMAIRPADKAAQNEADTKRYQAVMVKAKDTAVPDEQLAVILEEARQGDVPEIELLRDVAYNDVVKEINRPDAVTRLSFAQKLIAFFA